MNVFDAIIQRRSHRATFQKRAIDAADLEKLIEAARWTPSPFNVQPWELLLIQEAEGKTALADVTERSVVDQFKDAKFLDDNSRWMRLTEAEWWEHGDGVLLEEHVTLPKPLQDAPEKLLQSLLKNAKSFTLLGHLGAGKIPAKEIAAQVREAPLLMLITMNCKRYPPGEGGTRWMWLSMGMLIQNVLLAATALDIGVQFVSPPLERATDREQVRQLFNIPTFHEVITLLRMGYMEESGGNSVRLQSSEFVHFEKVV
ncbi:MAG: nitroreductase family protein [Candidatus Poribacteria bacterium]|nr:nitroreductase family protein [Candidatus Poribacteria bacterium]